MTLPGMVAAVFRLSARRHPALLAVMLVLTAGLAAMELGFLYALARLLHRVVAGPGVGGLVETLALIAVLTGALSVARLASGWGQDRLALGIGEDLAAAVFRHAMTRSFDAHRARRSEELPVALEDARIIAGTTLLPLFVACGAGVVIAALGLAALLIDWRTVLIGAPIVAVAYAAMIRATRGGLRQSTIELSGLRRARARMSNEALAGYRELLLAGGTDEAQRRFEGFGTDIARLTLRQRVLTNLPRAVIEPILFTLGIGIILAARAAPGGLIGSVPALGALAAGMLRTLQAMNMLSAAFGQLHASGPVLARLLDFTADAAGVSDDHDVSFRDEIRLEGVRVDYGRGYAALDGVDLHIRPGERIALVGPTGAGKSTLLHVLLGLVEPTHGRLSVDGAVLTGDPASRAGWQRSLAAVAQDIYLPDATIAEVVAGRGGDVDHARLAAALADAELDAWTASLAAGLATRLGDAGVMVSGGQRQRLALARALYRDAKVFVLDEATAQLDAATEQAILARLLALGPDRTVLFVTHHEQAARGFERLVRLEAGRIVADLRRGAP